MVMCNKVACFVCVFCINSNFNYIYSLCIHNDDIYFDDVMFVFFDIPKQMFLMHLIYWHHSISVFALLTCHIYLFINYSVSRIGYEPVDDATKRVPGY